MRTWIVSLSVVSLLVVFGMVEKGLACGASSGMEGGVEKQASVSETEK